MNRKVKNEVIKEELKFLGSMKEINPNDVKAYEDKLKVLERYEKLNNADDEIKSKKKLDITQVITGGLTLAGVCVIAFTEETHAIASQAWKFLKFTK